MQARLAELYGRVPSDTLDPQAAYFDQTDIARLQRAAVAAGKKNVIVIVFDGMDWQTTQAAAIYKSGKVGYREGRGTGLDFLDYRGAATDFGYFVSSPDCAELHRRHRCANGARRRRASCWADTAHATAGSILGLPETTPGI